jgi:hypothetical protein
VLRTWTDKADRQRKTFETLKLLKIRLQSLTSKKNDPRRCKYPMILIMQERNKQVPQGRWMRNSHDRRSAAHGRKNESGNIFVY